MKKKKPLAGKTIVITRAIKQSSELADMLSKYGANIIKIPTIETIPPTSWKRMDSAIQNLKKYDWIIFTSENGVRYFFNRLFQYGKDKKELNKIKICAIGPKTAREIERLGLNVDIIPDNYQAEAVVSLLIRRKIKGKKILLPRAKVARDVIPKELTKMGAKIDVVEAYRTIKPKKLDKLNEIYGLKNIDVITFTSSSTAKNFVEIVGKRRSQKLLKDVSIAAIGPITKKTVEDFGLNVDIVPRSYTMRGLTNAIVKHFDPD